LRGDERRRARSHRQAVARELKARTGDQRLALLALYDQANMQVT
jgi:hypothetical protein